MSASGALLFFFAFLLSRIGAEGFFSVRAEDSVCGLKGLRAWPRYFLLYRTEISIFRINLRYLILQDKLRRAVFFYIFLCGVMQFPHLRWRTKFPSPDFYLRNPLRPFALHMLVALREHFANITNTDM